MRTTNKTKDMRGVKADKECAKLTQAQLAKAIERFAPADDESEDESGDE